MFKQKINILFKKLLKKWSSVIIGMMFLSSGLYMVISNNVNEVVLVFISVFAAAYWWNCEL